MSKIFWIASYPKSGNTWFRAFLTNFLKNTMEPAGINELDVSWICANRRAFDDELGIESSDLSDDEISRFRPEVYRHMAARSPETLFWKIHDAYRSETLVPSDATGGVVYLVRNPLDVSISFAHHSQWTLDHTIEMMSRDSTMLAGTPGRLSLQLRQELLSWSNHVLSWLDQKAIPVHLVRYEDLCDRPLETFGNAIQFLGMADDPARVSRSASFSSFEELQQQEQLHGFKERPSELEFFFRKGKQGAWRDVLTQKQLDRVIRDHGAVMRRTGYLP